MTNKEMQRFLVRELDNGSTELEAYRSLMKILDIHLPLDGADGTKETTEQQA